MICHCGNQMEKPVKVCSDCGAEIKTGIQSPRCLCPDCKKKHNVERRRKYYANSRNSDEWKSVHKCEICGAGLKSYQAKLCVECKKAKVKEQKHKRYISAKKETDPCAYEVIKDPDNNGGFPPGARIKKEEIKFMLTMKSFTPGTLLKDYYGRPCIIEEKESKQTARRL